jgi:hydrogenase maturation protease
MRIVLIGIGQTLRGDDGAGPASVQWWEKKYYRNAPDPSIRILYAETPGLSLLEFLEGFDAAVFVDSIQTGRPPGSISIFNPVPSPEKMVSSGKTAHGIGLLETLAIANRTGHPLPSRLILVGIEAARFDIGEDLDPVVRSALPQAAKAIQDCIAKLLST